MLVSLHVKNLHYSEEEVFLKTTEYSDRRNRAEIPLLSVRNWHLEQKQIKN